MTSATYIFRETTRPEPIRDSALTFLRIYDLLISAGFLYIFASSALIPIGRAIERRSIGAVSVLAIVGLVFFGSICSDASRSWWHIRRVGKYRRRCNSDRSYDLGPSRVRLTIDHLLRAR